MKNILALGAAALLLSCQSASIADMPETAIVNPATLDAALKSMVNDGRTVGINVLVFEDGREAYAGSFGYKNYEGNDPMTRDALFQIYSMTKPVTGAALMTLYEDGLFELDDPITDYVPEMANLVVYDGTDENGEIITTPIDRTPTVIDFMRHTSGLMNSVDGGPLGGLYAKHAPRAGEMSLPDMADGLGQIPLYYQPGTQWRYSDSVDIQALMVERLSGMPFEDYLKAEIFDPLGMDETRHYVKPERRGRMASLYVADETGQLDPAPNASAHAYNYNPDSQPRGGWGLVSTVDDYSRFARMLLNKGEFDGVRILEPDTVALMATDHLPDDVTERHWLAGKGQLGFGIDFAVRTAPPASADENYGVSGEFFWDGYASTLFWVDPENDLIAIFLTQKINFDNSLHYTFRNAVYDVMERGED